MQDKMTAYSLQEACQAILMMAATKTFPKPSNLPLLFPALNSPPHPNLSLKISLLT